MGKGTEDCGLFWCHFHYAEPFFQVSLMIRWCRKLLLYMINLSLYCRNISFFLFWVRANKNAGRHTFWVAVDFWPLPLIFPKTIGFIPCGTKTQKIKRIDHNKYNVRASKNGGRHTFWVAVDFWLLPLNSSQRLLHSFLLEPTSRK